jgi:hypothetical protein
LLGCNFDGDKHSFTAAERNRLIIINNRIYKHKVLRVNYTTYDLRREQDSLNSRTHADFMTLSHEDDIPDHKRFPYWFGRIIGIFHTMVRYQGAGPHLTKPQRFNFLFVRWFGRELNHQAGWKSKRLHRIGFVDGDDDTAFGFLDPQEVIRGVHLIPAFKYGQTTTLLPPSTTARVSSEKDQDWLCYYVNM